jgi:2-oxo-4-hydroxy-4-carboxy--5-ureidoimidazoline (OHCU) decarboxylase
MPVPPTLTDLFESAPRFAERLRDERAASVAELLDRAERLAADLPEDEQIELLNGHPRIGADPATGSATSFREQGYDRSPPATEPQLAERLARLNEAYEDRFGFRFVVFVAGRPRSEIADFLETRLDADRDEELGRALHDVFAIARDRLDKGA